MKELITIPKEWIEKRIKILRITNQSPLENSINSNIVNELVGLLNNSKSAEEVFNSARKKSYYNGEQNGNWFTNYQDYLNSL